MSSHALATESLAAIDAAVERAMADGRTPGLALAVVGHDGPLAVGTYGFADLAARIPVAPEHLFEIGSIGKMFTAIAILQLAEEGRLDLHRPVAAYLPWFDVPSVGDAGPIAIHHLLSHTAGIVSGVDATPEAAFQVRSLRDLTPGSAPGERYHYSNVGYKALGLLLARLEGRPYPEVIRRRVLEPLGMTASEPAIANAIRARLAVGYENREDDRIGHAGRALAPATWLETDTADGSIASTATDMAALVSMLLCGGEGPAGRLLSEASFAALRAPHARPDVAVTYGYGVSQRTIGERTFIGHGGGMVGYRAAVQAEPDAGIGTVVLQNGPGGSPMALAREVIAIAAGWTIPVASTADPGPSDAAGGLVGRWRPDEPDAPSMDVQSEEGALVVHLDGVAINLASTPRSRPFVCDWRCDGPPDVLLGSGDGRVRLYQGTYEPGDANCDGLVDFDDINPFVRALVGYEVYKLHHPDCHWLDGDCNGDGDVDFDDIRPFVAKLESPPG